MTTEIRPNPTRETFVKAIEAADRFADAAARTENLTLIGAAGTARREAWIALEAFDKTVRDAAVQKRAAKSVSRLFAQSTAEINRFAF